MLINFSFFLLGILTVVIEDENDNNPLFRKSFYRCSVTENSQTGVNIANIIADDADKNKTINYSLQGIYLYYKNIFTHFYDYSVSVAYLIKIVFIFDK